MERDEILRVLRAFEKVQLEYVLIGAAAMGIHGVVRATEDLDLFIRATAENIERLKSAFRTVYDNDPNIDEISADDLLGDYPAVRYYPPSGDLYFDVMTRLGQAASFESVVTGPIPLDPPPEVLKPKPKSGVMIGPLRRNAKGKRDGPAERRRQPPPAGTVRKDSLSP